MQSEEIRTVKGRNGGTLKPFRPGKSGNEKGKLPGTRNYKTILTELLEVLDKKEGGNGEALKPLSIRLIKKMDSKNEIVGLKAIQEIAERIEGKVDENIILNTVEMPKIIIERDPD